jgi:hypothetical protein
MAAVSSGVGILLRGGRFSIWRLFGWWMLGGVLVLSLLEWTAGWNGMDDWVDWVDMWGLGHPWRSGNCMAVWGMCCAVL